MSEVVLGDLLEKRGSEMKEITQSLVNGDGEKTAAGLAGLLTTVLTGVPALGNVVAQGLEKIFGSSANAILVQQIEAWQKEQQQTDLVSRVRDSVEVLLGQALIQLVRSQHASTAELERALGGIREELKGFRDSIQGRLEDAGIRVDLQEIAENGIGIRVGEKARASVFVRRQVVNGGVGIDLT